MREAVAVDLLCRQCCGRLDAQVLGFDQQTRTLVSGEQIIVEHIEQVVYIDLAQLGDDLHREGLPLLRSQFEHPRERRRRDWRAVRAVCQQLLEQHVVFGRDQVAWPVREHHDTVRVFDDHVVRAPKIPQTGDDRRNAVCQIA